MNAGQLMPVLSLDELERVAGSPSGSKIQVFVSFDIERDEELYELLLTQTRTSSFGFAVLGSSERMTATDDWSERARLQIRAADQVIVICGEHTEASPSVHAELRIAQEERTPYFLLWGRPGVMCTKPIGAKTDDVMYSWTGQILQNQMAFTARQADANATAETMRHAARKG